MRHAWVGMFLFVLACAGSTWAAAVQVDDLRCEYLRDPLGVDAAQPRLTWILTSDARGQHQTGYQVLVASTPELLKQDQGDLWDSGKVTSDETAQIVYAGKPLASRQACFWKVRVWDRDGAASDWSKPARWEMGLLEAKDWSARWIEAQLKSDANPSLDSLQGATWIWSQAASDTLQGQPAKHCYIRCNVKVPAEAKPRLGAAHCGGRRSILRVRERQAAAEGR